ncbi:type II toxin-antitoxin system HipA family toxin [Microbacterium aurantiacum]|uniref:type II toxin-antitoxin system HipA family toxin n=1 Tax=Microbacterium aurantiacum TaxID=162393 RepID=UPI0040366C29
MNLDIHVVLPSGREVLAGSVDDTGGIIAFEYARSYISDTEAYPLAPSLRLGRGEYIPASGRAMVPGLADAQPDSWGRRVMQSLHRKRTGRFSHLSELDVLRNVTDDERLGALRVVNDGSYEGRTDAATASLRDLPRLIEAAAAFERGEEVPEDLLPLLQAGTSMGGARPKATVVNERGDLAIAKLPGENDFGDAMAWEATSLELARRAGVRTPAFHLHRFEHRSVLVLERFDRDGDRRVGYLSADGLLNKTHGTHVDYVTLAGSMQRHSASADTESHELFRRIALSLLINNVDDHMKNHGFLRERKGWTLSPVFDLNPFYRQGAVESTPVSIDDDPSDRDVRVLVASHDAFRLTTDEATSIVREVEAATSNWRDVALSFGITPEALTPMQAAFDSPNRRRALDLVPNITGGRTPDPRGGPQPRDSAGRFGRKRNSPPDMSL